VPRSGGRDYRLVAFDAPAWTRFAWQMLTAPAIGAVAGSNA